MVGRYKIRYIYSMMICDIVSKWLEPVVADKLLAVEVVPMPVGVAEVAVEVAKDSLDTGKQM